MRKWVFIVVLSIVSASAWAQANIFSNTGYDSAREEYIKTYPNHFFIWPVLKQRKLEFELVNRPTREQSLSYKSNKPFSFGLGMYLFELAFELTLDIPLNEQSKKIYGNSDARDFQLNILSKKWGVDVFRQKYSGFYIVDANEKIPVDVAFPQRPDIETRNIGISTNYTFNNKKFSFRSAYNFVERQLKSRGSFLMFGSLNSFRVTADSSIIGYKYDAAFGTDAKILKIRTTILGLAPGYTYSLIHKGFFLNGTLAAGPAHNWLAYEVQGGKTNNDINFSAFIIARIAIGYNGDKFFGGLSFTNQGLNAKFENLELSSSNSTFKVLVGYRFREVGFLQKRVWDIPERMLN
jgi:hypothetical protein